MTRFHFIRNRKILFFGKRTGIIIMLFAMLSVTLNYQKGFVEKQVVLKEEGSLPLTTAHLVTVVCGDRLPEALNMLKSALTFADNQLHVHVFAEHRLHHGLHEALSGWPENVTWIKFNYSIANIRYTRGHADIWNKIFRPCASQRLFLPDLLPDVDSVLYVDTDCIFLSDPQNIIAHLNHFNENQLAAMSPNSEKMNNSWYQHSSVKHPYVQPYGLNSGVMLMNLTRMRNINWTLQMWPIYEKYGKALTLGDQDVLNAFFHVQPDFLYMLDCTYNFRPDHCWDISAMCLNARIEGVRVLHGNRRNFHKKKKSIFNTIYGIFDQYTLGDNRNTSFVHPNENQMNSPCKELGSLLLRNIQQYMRNV